MTANPRWSAGLRTMCSVVRRMRGGPVEQPAGERAVGEHEPHPGGAGRRRSRTGLAPSRSCIDAAQDHDGEQQAEGVGDDEPLAAVDLLPGVVAAACPGRRCRRPSRSGSRSARHSAPGCGPPATRSCSRTTARIFSVTFACSQRMKYQYTVCQGGKSARQLPPRAPGPHHVEDRVHDRPTRMLLRPPTGLHRRQQRLDQRPLLIGQVRRVARARHHPSTVDGHELMIR